MYIPRLKLLLLACAASLAVVACDDVQVYHSMANDGVMTPPPTMLPDGNPVSLNLFIRNLGNSARSTPESICNGGSGAEVCLWNITVGTGGGAQLVSFQPAPNVRFNLVGNVLRATGGSPLAPPLLGDRIGTLTVRATSAGSVSASGEFVSSLFSVGTISPSSLSTAAP
jgi:hypothetical protein